MKQLLFMTAKKEILIENSMAYEWNNLSSYIKQALVIVTFVIVLVLKIID
jgi:hypothetical protein